MYAFNYNYVHLCIHILLLTLYHATVSRGHIIGHDIFLAPTILIQVCEVDFITEEDDPLAQLYGCHDHSVGGPPILTVVVKRLQKKLWRGSTGEVKSNNL